MPAHQLPQSPKSTFYSRLNETLEAIGFAGKVREACAPAYKTTKAGRPGIDPVVLAFLLLMHATCHLQRDSTPIQ